MSSLKDVTGIGVYPQKGLRPKSWWQKLKEKITKPDSGKQITNLREEDER